MGENFDTGRLAEDLRALVQDAETLLRAANASGTEGDLRQRAEATLREMRARLGDIEASVRAHARDIDDYVHENPWSTIAVAGGVGLLLGLLLGRR